MKRFLSLLVVALLLPIVCLADGSTFKTQLERKGILYSLERIKYDTEFNSYYVSSDNQVKLYVFLYKLLSDNNVYYAIQLKTSSGTPIDPVEKFEYVEIDEVDNLIESLGQIKAELKEPQEKKIYNVVYNSLNGIVFNGQFALKNSLIISIDDMEFEIADKDIDVIDSLIGCLKDAAASIK